MAALPYIQLYVADYLADTAHLTTEESGAYLLLIFNYWQRGKALDNSDEQLALVCKLPEERWAKAKNKLARFFEVQGSDWYHARIERDLAAVAEKSQKAKSANAQRTFNGRGTNAERTFNHTDTEVDTDLLSTANAVEDGFEKSDPPIDGSMENSQADGSHEDGDQGSKPKRNRVPYAEIVAAYHEVLLPAGCPRFEVFSDERKGLMRQRWLQHMPSIDQWVNYFRYVQKSKFLTGKAAPKPDQPPFVADLEWLCRPRNFAKVAEGKYHR